VIKFVFWKSSVATYKWRGLKLTYSLQNAEGEGPTAKQASTSSSGQSSGGRAMNFFETSNSKLPTSTTNSR
jgi:hypothetical protein